jgi:outer membrane immunogenic protein
MKKILLGTVAALSLGVVATTSHAADLVDYPVAAAYYDWSGAYGGAQFGILGSNSEASYDRTGFPGFYAPLDPDGIVGGIFGGYNFATGQGLVFGIEGEFNLTNASGSSPLLDGNAGGAVVAGQAFSGDIDWTAAGRVRLGYALDRVMPYIAGGVAIADYSVANTVGGTTETAYDETLVGWTIGGGVEWAATDTLITRVDVRYSEFDRKLANTVVFDDYDVSLNTLEIKVGVAYKF